MPVALSIEADAADGNLDKCKVWIIIVGYTSIGEIYLLSLENQFGEKGYELYRYTGREDYGSSCYDTTDLDLICATFDD